MKIKKRCLRQSFKILAPFLKKVMMENYRGKIT